MHKQKAFKHFPVSDKEIEQSSGRIGPSKLVVADEA
jgi:hypothetical protein